MDKYEDFKDVDKHSIYCSKRVRFCNKNAKKKISSMDDEKL